MNIVMKTEFPDLKLAGRGKVRDIYDLGDKLLIVSTDRLSAFDVILPEGIEKKGKVLTELSKFWFDKTSHIIKNHLITTRIEEMPAEVQKYKDILEGMKTVFNELCRNKQEELYESRKIQFGMVCKRRGGGPVCRHFFPVRGGW